MSRNLEIVQKTSKVLGILSKIGYICSIVGAVCCLVAVSILFIAGKDPEIVAKIQQGSKLTIKQTMGACFIGLVYCISSILITKWHLNYFLMEQKEGTPFTEEGAKAFRTLGIVNIVIPFVAVIIASILEAVFKSPHEVRPDASFGLGIAMILISYVFGYGAELEKKKGASEEKSEDK
ncbi:MAG: hypothetical protein J6P81_00035 [Spirochaetales bacterium]|nr:hypothetical protein [Spirochaetales bacterium]